MANTVLKLVVLMLLTKFIDIGFAAKKPAGVQKRSLIIKDGYFYPDKLILFENESLHLMVGNFMGHSTCLANESLRFFINVSPGNVVEQQIYFKNEGEYQFNCPGLKSNLTILIRPKPILGEKKYTGLNRAPEIGRAHV